MHQLVERIGGYMALRGTKKNQHYVSMGDDFKAYYEVVGKL